MTTDGPADTPVCALCGRPERLTRHHLIPRARHRNRRTRRQFSLAELQTRVIPVCRPCHNHIHRTLTEKDLERDYNTLEALRAHPEIQRFTRWIAARPVGFKPKSPQR
ncbi:hypothetical protein [Aquisalimonas asiatica]|uniref:HNH endonuclease n=1 Tax=Aquisalimonas asiatica TaxID=406100 RepID=A0A1H8TLN1_9GAMM|nr:hypothetical protein [Aquisalimonas asiatica]SEO91721.1 hypothetical protein SAMN04488052_104296 [Aquisalimonas asiatica]